MRIDPALKSGIVEQVPGVDQNGRPAAVVNWVVTPEEDEQIRQGYRCPFDMQVYRQAYPDECPICKLTSDRAWFSPKQHQSMVYEQMSRGEHRYGPSDPDEGYDPEFENWTRKTGVLLPGRDF